MMFVSAWLPSLSEIVSRFIHVAANGIISWRMYAPPLLIHSAVDGQVGYFHDLAIINSLAMKLWCMYLFDLWFLWIHAQELDC